MTGPLVTYVLGNLGDTIEIDTPDDISLATEMTLRFQKPDGTTVDVEAEFTTDGTDGKVIVETDETFSLDQEGTWKVRANVVLPGGTYSTLPAEFYVEEDLSEPEP